MTLVSCKQRREAIRQLGCAQTIIETAPDSALVFLDSIRSHPRVLDKRHRMEYETAMVQAKYKCYKDISEDTAVFEARRYFVNKRLQHYTADVCMRNGENTRCRWKPIKKR